MVYWTSYHPPIDLKASPKWRRSPKSRLSKTGLRMDGRMTGGWSCSSSYGSALCTSGFQPPMVQWKDDLQMKNEEWKKMKNEEWRMKNLLPHGSILLHLTSYILHLTSYILHPTSSIFLSEATRRLASCPGRSDYPSEYFGLPVRTARTGIEGYCRSPQRGLSLATTSKNNRIIWNFQKKFVPLQYEKPIDTANDSPI